MLVSVVLLASANMFALASLFLWFLESKFFSSVVEQVRVMNLSAEASKVSLGASGFPGNSCGKSS